MKIKIFRGLIKVVGTIFFIGVLLLPIIGHAEIFTTFFKNDLKLNIGSAIIGFSVMLSTTCLLVGYYVSMILNRPLKNDPNIIASFILIPSLVAGIAVNAAMIKEASVEHTKMDRSMEIKRFVEYCGQASINDAIYVNFPGKHTDEFHAGQDKSKRYVNNFSIANNCNVEAEFFEKNKINVNFSHLDYDSCIQTAKVILEGKTKFALPKKSQSLEDNIFLKAVVVMVNDEQWLPSDSNERLEALCKNDGHKVIESAQISILFEQV